MPTSLTPHQIIAEIARLKDALWRWQYTGGNGANYGEQVHLYEQAIAELTDRIQTPTDGDDYADRAAWKAHT
jgi:hypothetical protein